MVSVAIYDERPGASGIMGQRVGWGLSILAALFLIADAAGKLIAPETMIAYSPPLGLPAETGFYRLLGAILAICTALYVWPRTAILGAVLLTGYLGGAVATHLRVDSPLFSHTLFGVYLGAMIWGGLWLRNRRVRGLFN
ncbi:MAG TPA: DoxX family protein [Sphingomicrobium sp.]